MAQVKVRMMGTLSRRLSGGEVELSLEPPVEVGQAIRVLFERLGGGEALLDPESLSAEALILINGVEIANLEGLKTPVEDGDLLIILPVTHGG